jgi:hypothetical protein
MNQTQGPKDDENENQRDSQTPATAHGSKEQTRLSAEEAADAARGDEVDIVMIDFDDIDEEIIALDALIDREIIVLDLTEEDDMQSVRDLLDEARERRLELAGSNDQTRSGRKSLLKEATDRLRDVWSRTRDKIESARQSRDAGASERPRVRS